MLRGVKGLHGATLNARDGEIGRVDEILFDDEHWTVRYLVVDTGGWLPGRKVLITPRILGALDWTRRQLDVNLTRDQVERSPGIESDEPLSRQMESDYYDYYGWPYYWGGGMNSLAGMGVSGAGWYPGPFLGGAGGGPTQQLQDERAREHKSGRDHGDAHLRSTQELTGYGIVAQDGRLGHVEDFIFDDGTWAIRYLAVDTREWWLGKHILIPPDLVSEAVWPDGIVTVKITCDQVQNSPEWDPTEPIGHIFEDRLAAYYADWRRGDSERELGRPHALR